MIFRKDLRENATPQAIITNMIIAAVSLFVNGFGVYLTIQANIGANPWDVLNLGLSNTFGILYGTAAILVSYSILGIDILMKGSIGIAMFIDAVVVGKAVDLFNRLNVVKPCESVGKGIFVMMIGLFIMAYTQYFYMSASLGCGPRDTLLVCLTKRLKRFPIGVISIGLLSIATLVGWLLGGPVGIGTLICAFGMGPTMQLAFKTMRFEATEVHHQNLSESFKVFIGKAK